MKKIFLGIGIILLILLGLTYWSVSTTPKNLGSRQISGMGDIEKINFRQHDSIVMAANTLYEGTNLKELMQGEQYRDAWAMPIKVPIVYLDTLFGGMKVIEEGGGKQTHSLKLESANGIIYTLRSIVKDPEPLIPEVAKTLGLENIIIDGISAQHPYAAVVVAALAKHADILSTHPKIVFVPKQPTLDKFNDKYGNRMFLLEYETEGKSTWIGYANLTEIMDTEDLQEFKRDNPDKISIDQAALVKARLFDLLIGDWDRHAKQWGWAIQKNGNSYNAIPLPCDRDNAFFNLEGVIPTIIANKKIHPKVQSFKNEVEFLNGLVGPFDVYFLKNVPESVFISQAENLQHRMTNEVITRAFQIWPRQIYDLDGDEIISKIISRRENMTEYAKQFKKILDERELILEPLIGSEDLELNEELMGCFDCMASNSKP
ncbi:hypothetical protein H4O18_12810 [Arenibacter sp. BSSL-BM3]|uniref:Uncharacterized protein n=1 Tax=Arenibacter arenosicollis TaxID=2762274 RepID=A0ABR7QNU9_9FLAO|nr:hypothetical protein [Arenibacter arenosicollis]MBC8768875.1 hypothetical protein [Arenibacter arenosicollis]